MKSQFLSTFTKLSHSKLPYITNKTSPNRQVNLTINTSRSNKSLSPKTKTKRRILKTSVSAIETEDQQIVKKLNLWEQDNLNYKKENYEMLYKSLTEIYKRENNQEKLAELQAIEKLLKSNSIINKTFEKVSKVQQGGALEKIYQEKQLEQRALLLNTISKTSARFNFSSFNTFNTINKEDNKESVDNEEGNQVVYRKVINEHSRKENNMRNDLMEISRKVNMKKDEKNELLRKLDELYTMKKRYEEDFFQKKNKLKIDFLNLQDHYDLSQKKLSKVKASREEVFNNILKNASHGNAIENKINSLKEELNNNNLLFEKSKTELIKRLNVLHEEEDYLKYTYFSMLREQREYYYKILKNGYDVRYEGLVWVVRHLLEMNSVLEYHHFPKFLDHDQINYLISLAQLFLEENIMTITLKSLKAKQQRIRAEANANVYNKLTDFCNAKDKNKTKKFKFYITNKKTENTIKNRLLLTFSNLHDKYKEAFKFFDDKKIDEENISKIIREIRTSLLKTGNYSNKEKENGLVKFFEDNADNKEELEMILFLRDRIKEIQKEKESMRKDMLEQFKEREKDMNRYKNAQQSLEYELRCSALFGCNFSCN